MAESIAGTVTAMICVVVGLLIIGCALVPIVDNASITEKEEIIKEDRSGYNETSSGVDYLQGYLAELDDLQIISDGNTLTVNGTEYSGSEFRVYPRIGDTWWAKFSGPTITLRSALTGAGSDVNLNSGTFAYSDDTITVTGPNYSFTKIHDHLVISNAQVFTSQPDTELYGRMTSPITSCIIGEGQNFISSGGTVYTLDSTNLPAGVTIVKNENETFATVDFTSGAWYGPYEWAGTKTTIVQTTEESEYKALYGIIPIMCILGMAYVLIRRF